jgi:hypothetical protein
MLPIRANLEGRYRLAGSPPVLKTAWAGFRPGQVSAGRFLIAILCDIKQLPRLGCIISGRQSCRNFLNKANLILIQGFDDAPSGV